MENLAKAVLVLFGLSCLFHSVLSTCDIPIDGNSDWPEFPPVVTNPSGTSFIYPVRRPRKKIHLNGASIISVSSSARLPVRRQPPAEAVPEREVPSDLLRDSLRGGRAGGRRVLLRGGSVSRNKRKPVFFIEVCFL